MADLFIIGQFNHVDAITAVSNGSQVMHMLTVIIVGLAMGATVTISRAIGANKKLDAARAIGNTVTLFMAVSVLFTVLLLLLVTSPLSWSVSRDLIWLPDIFPYIVPYGNGRTGRFPAFRPDLPDGLFLAETPFRSRPCI